ncbi:Jacalin-like lectin domain superfamily [Arabidopsis thaliana x Arabidopsis arenosa]|uniref:Jacalin-like lectin domain superfamily n=1 Tax=Arabidopsis thaliana x Arabidopsis arenosa TaxID=1240361 RepID=A0A8T2AU90_9BRAS|nr:Jacalin-like lectin domain superfamily [Arabidopsis thaliana x Arabidopsis arenosa]
MAQKVEAQGGKGGNQWDDGSVHDAVTKIQVGAGGLGIQYVQFDYVKNGQTEQAPLRGIKGRVIAADPFVINHPDEHLVSVEGWYSPEGVIQGLKFISNKKTSDVIGYEDGTQFTLKVKDKKIIGFHGSAGDNLNSLGAYFAPLTSTTPLTPAKQLPALGSDDGAAWDDGAYVGVKKVYVGQAQDGISAVKFVYDKSPEEVVGEEHGKSTLLGFEELVLDYPSEYITAVEGTYDKIFGSEGSVITMLMFKTNKQTSPPFGLEAGTAFELKEEGHKIVGFHGRAGDLLHKFGVHVRPVSN